MFTTSPWRRAGAELVGTYELVTAGCGAIVINTSTGALTHLGIALTFGLIMGYSRDTVKNRQHAIS